MSLPLIIVGIVAAGAQALFSPRSPLLWEGSSSKLVLTPRSLLTGVAMGSPQKLTLRARPASMSSSDLPHFWAKEDKTITLDAMGYQWCIEAGGDKRGDAVRINFCTAGPSQLWNVLPWGNEGKTLLQLRDSNQCIGVQEGGSNEAEIQLRDCDTTAAELWEFDVPSFTASSARMRHVIFSCLALAVAGGLSLTSWLSRGRPQAMAMKPAHVLSSMEQGGGMALITSDNFQLGSRSFTLGLDVMASTVMALAPAATAPKTETSELTVFSWQPGRCGDVTMSTTGTLAPSTTLPKVIVPTSKKVVMPKLGGGGGGGGRGGSSGGGGGGNGDGSGALRQLRFLNVFEKADIVEDWLKQTTAYKMSADFGETELASQHARAEEALKALSEFKPTTIISSAGICVPHCSLRTGVRLMIALVEPGQPGPGEVGGILKLAAASVACGQLRISDMAVRPTEVHKPDSTVSKDMSEGLECYAEKMGIPLVYMLTLPTGNKSADMSI